MDERQHDKARERGRLSGRADVFGEGIEGDAVGTGDVLLGGVVRPGREDQEATGGNGIKEES
jgi:hypothetical protein